MSPFLIPLILAALLLPTLGCSSVDITEQPPPLQPSVANGTPTYDGSPNLYLLLNQKWIEGLATEGPDFDDVDAVFWHIFSGLPDEVVVYPTENYFYFTLYSGGRQFTGNIRLPVGTRDDGDLAFAYFEFSQSGTIDRNRFTRTKHYTPADGVTVSKIDNFTYDVSYGGKSVIFNLNQIPQDPPKSFPLGQNEVFVQHTFDESGYRFFLLFNEESNYFLWVLDEEHGLTDRLETAGEDLLKGKRSGFVFWRDSMHGGRKILVGVSRLNISRNNFYDGPFDQLADNYVDDDSPLSEYMQRSLPGLRGKVNKYGYRTDTDRQLRVALANYYSYISLTNLESFMERAHASDNVYWYISRSGRAKPSSARTPTPTTPTP